MRGESGEVSGEESRASALSTLESDQLRGEEGVLSLVRSQRPQLLHSASSSGGSKPEKIVRRAHLGKSTVVAMSCREAEVAVAAEAVLCAGGRQGNSNSGVRNRRMEPRLAAWVLEEWRMSREEQRG